MNWSALLAGVVVGFLAAVGPALVRSWYWEWKLQRLLKTTIQEAEEQLARLQARKNAAPLN